MWSTMENLCLAQRIASDPLVCDPKASWACKKSQKECQCSGWTANNLNALHCTLKQERSLSFPCSSLKWSIAIGWNCIPTLFTKNCGRSFIEVKTRRLPCCVIHVTLLRVDVGWLWSAHYSTRARVNSHCFQNWSTLPTHSCLHALWFFTIFAAVKTFL